VELAGKSQSTLTNYARCLSHMVLHFGRSQLNNGKRDNVIKDIDNDILIALIIGFVRNFSFHLVHRNNGQLTEQLTDSSFALCWDAIKK